MIGLFYHAWADGNWETPLSEHVDAMKKAGLNEPLHMGVIGASVARGRMYDWLNDKQLKWELAAEADTGYEEVTLMAVHDWARRHGHGSVLYMHDKGALHTNDFEAKWRKRVTRELVGRWEHCVNLLRHFDAIGCHWLHPQQDWPRAWPQDGNVIRVSHPHFSGNFFWATTDYLWKLPVWPYEIPHTDSCCTRDSVPQARGETSGRWLAELWLGLGDPKVCDLYPGLPGEYIRRDDFTLSLKRS